MTVMDFELVPFFVMRISFGVEIPSDMDGRVLEEIFTDEYMARNPVRRSDATETDFVSADESYPMTDDESEEIRQRLKGFGYLG